STVRSSGQEGHRSPGSSPPVRSQASAEAACTAATRWRERSWAGASSPVCGSVASSRPRRRHERRPEMPQTDLTALVTGGTSGIGRAAGAALAAKGSTVITTSRDLERLAPEQRVSGVRYLLLDLTDPDRPDALAEELGEEIGAVDVLINNAGESQS